MEYPALRMPWQRRVPRSAPRERTQESAEAGLSRKKSLSQQHRSSFFEYGRVFSVTAREVD